jgi:hypothetical protein
VGNSGQVLQLVTLVATTDDLAALGLLDVRLRSELTALIAQHEQGEPVLSEPRATGSAPQGVDVDLADRFAQQVERGLVRVN